MTKNQMFLEKVNLFPGRWRFCALGTIGENKSVIA
jgi:hypothetical protein